MIVTALLLSSCAAPRFDTLTQALHACQSGARYDEIRERGDVVRVLGVRDSRSGMHEGFLVAIASRTWRVEDNVDITGPIPLHRGEPIELQGQFECDDGVIHWTHRDPGGRHIAGYIEVDGRRYR